ncbi:hypothetical protein [Rubidibacter lacunae]|uniref:hypothetical protein n=1 Tax=Rubidibacter lacunae TaxID=582514 RepID=UPI000407AC3D|nr:hypothetical protein [Rubidibacter lacunae]
MKGFAPGAIASYKQDSPEQNCHVRFQASNGEIGKRLTAAHAWRAADITAGDLRASVLS